MRLLIRFATAGVIALISLTGSAFAAPVSLALTTGAANKLDLGFFAGGSTINLVFTGNGDVVDSRFQTRPDGSLFAPASGVYSFANNGASYPALFGGDGINRYAGGGAAYDYTGSGFGFAGAQSTDSTNSATIRFGAIVGTFVGTPTRADWFLVGNGATITAPTGGANLYLAVNDTFSGDNHGTYSGSVVVVPEASAAYLIGMGLPFIGIVVRRKKQ